MTSEAGTFELDTRLLKCALPPVFAYARILHVFLEVGLFVVLELSLHSSSVACLPACLPALFVRRPPHFFFALLVSLSLSLSPFLFFLLDSIYWTGLMWRHYIGVSWLVRQEFCSIGVGIQWSVALKFGSWGSIWNFEVRHTVMFQ